MKTRKKTTQRKTSAAASTPGRTTSTQKASSLESKKAARKTASQPKAYKGVRIGQSVPAFRLPATGGGEFGHTELRGKITILYFYPKDNTPGCTLEGHDFKARIPELKRLNAQVVGVSRDSIKSHENFKAKCGFPFELVSDPSDALGRIFDVIQMKKLYGRVFEGIERSTFVIDSDGCLRREWRKVRVDGHADEVVDYIRKGMPK